jgi:hypothetical protein
MKKAFCFRKIAVVLSLLIFFASVDLPALAFSADNNGENENATESPCTFLIIFEAASIWNGGGIYFTTLACEGDLTLTGTVNFNGGQIYAEQDVTIAPGGSLGMANGDDALIVLGDLVVNATSNIYLANGYLDLKGDLTVNSNVNFTTSTAVHAQFSGSGPQTVTYPSGRTVMFGTLAFTGDDPSHVTVYKGGYVPVTNIYTNCGTLLELEDILEAVVKVEFEVVDTMAAVGPGALVGGGHPPTTVNGGGNIHKIVFRTDKLLFEHLTRQVDVGEYARAMGATVYSFGGYYTRVEYEETTHDFLIDVKRNIYDINEIFGWVNCWIPNEKDYAVYTATYRFGVPICHACIVVFAAPNTALHNGDDFAVNNYYEGVRYATLGAGPEPLFSPSAKLVSSTERFDDKIMSVKQQMINMEVYDIETISNLFGCELNYRGKSSQWVDYTLFPDPKTEEYNSNSFAHGLLAAAGITPIKPNLWLPGWCNPLPQSFFEQEEE